MLKKIFARMGVGSATVDTVLTTEHFVQGGEVKGQIEIKGGDVEQEISAIKLDLMTKVKQEGENIDVYVNFTIASFVVGKPMTLEPGREMAIPFRFKLHPETPVTVLDVRRNKCKVWVQTALDIDFSLDPKDLDYLHIHPNPVVKHFIESLNKNGYSMVKADVEKGFLRGDNFTSKSGCYQEMEFKPRGFGFGRVKEVELSFISERDRTHVLIELDRGFLGDGYQCMTLSNQAGYAEVDSRVRSLVG